MYYEEVDLFKKLREAGYDVYFLNDVSAIHYGGESTKKNYEMMRLEQQNSLIVYVRKWHGVPWARIIYAMFVALAFIRLLWAKIYKYLNPSSGTEGERFLNTASFLFYGLLKIRIKSNG
jgi:GT2 family glycosyltransferase